MNMYPYLFGALQTDPKASCSQNAFNLSNLLGICTVDVRGERVYFLIQIFIHLFEKDGGLSSSRISVLGTEPVLCKLRLAVDQGIISQ